MKLPRAFAKKVARILVGKKADNVRILDVTRLSQVTDFFVFATATSAIHNRALARELKGKTKDQWELHHLEGAQGGDWILLDFVDVIVHLFLPETRSFYALEELWGDAREVEFSKRA